MPNPTCQLAGLAFLPRWLDACPDRADADARLAAWGEATDWPRVGLSWPTLDVPSARPAGAICVPLRPPGHDAGIVWAQPRPGEPWTEGDQVHLTLAAAMVERSPAIDAWLGRAVDPAELTRRLADAAVIAGRMAHEFDNILTGVLGFADLALPLADPDSQLAAFVRGCAEAGQRGIAFTQQLHDLSRCAQPKPQAGSVAAAVETVRRQLAASAPTVTVTADLPADLPPVAMEAGPLTLVLGHLLRNAAEAMPAGGSVAVTAAVADLSADEARGFLGDASPGANVIVTVRDAGPGLMPETRARLFRDPFVTTKPRHRGLGLAVVYRSVHAHNGGVRVEPAVADTPGVTVRLALPLGRVLSQISPKPTSAPSPALSEPRAALKPSGK
jgi:signal transduction histidine kinase